MASRIANDSNVLRHDLLENNTLEDPAPEAIAASIHRSLDDVKAGRTKPLAELWLS